MNNLFTMLLAFATFFAFNQDSYARGWASAAVPTHIEIERGGGFMVLGAFGNAGNCSKTGSFYVKSDHPQYDKLYATVLAAYMAGKKVKPYIHSCEPVTWHAVSSVTYNTMTRYGALYIQD